MQEYIYKKMYLHLFNAITSVLRNFKDRPEAAWLLLEAAQIDCEHMYIKAKNKKPLFPFLRDKNSPE